MEIGQKVFFKPERGELEEGEIVKVGRKYFYVRFGKWREGVFYLEDLREKTYLGKGNKIYMSEKEYWDRVRSAKLFSLIRGAFRYMGMETYSVHQLEKVIDILGIEVES